MASYARCLLFLLFAIFFLQIHARESKFFSKVTKTTKQNNANIISLSPAVSPTLAPALSTKPQVVEHGYGLYGRDPYQNTPTKTVMPTKKTISGEQEKYVPAQKVSQTENNGENYPPEYGNPPKLEKYVPAQEVSQTENYGDNYQPGYGTTPYYPPKQEKYVPAQEVSQTKNYGDNYGPGYGATPYYPPKQEKYVPAQEVSQTEDYAENYPPKYGPPKQEKYVPAQEVSQTENYGDNYQPGYGTTPYYPPKQEKYAPAQEVSQTKNYGDNYVPSYGATPYYPPPHKPTTKNTIFGGQKYVHVEQSRNNNRNNGNVNRNKYQYSPAARNPVFGGEHKYVSERQGMSDTRFLENGKYYYDVNQDSKDVNSFVENEGKGYVPKKQGMSDTRFMENGKYFYDVQNQEGVMKGNQPYSNVNNYKNDQFQEENNGRSDTRYSNENEQFQEKKLGMSDTQYLDSGKYSYGVNDENVNNNKGNYGATKKFPNEYDTMEEYDKEQGYIDPQDVYVP